MKIKAILLTASLSLISATSWATLIGESVTGEINFGAGSTNYFDPANGFVPAGFLNAAGPTVTISGSDTEFGFLDGSNSDIADFTATQLIVTDDVFSTAANWTMRFTSTAFIGAGIGESADSFNNGGVNFSLVGDTITLNWAGTNAPANFRAVYDITTQGVPDSGSTVIMLGLGLVGLACSRKFKRA